MEDEEQRRTSEDDEEKKSVKSLSLEEEEAVKGGGGDSPQGPFSSETLDQSPTTTLPSNTFVSALKGQEKINIRLNPVGDAPILKQKLWAVPADREVGQIIEFVKKYLKLEKHQSLFVFVNQAFAPSPDQQLRELYECFGSDGKITLHYSTTYAWG